METIGSGIESLILIILGAMKAEYQKSTFALIESLIIVGLIWKNRSKSSFWSTLKYKFRGTGNTASTK
ncbi:MAG: hypothetical protein ACFFC6_11320 [Promethearchaeota archaeon]